MLEREQLLSLCRAVAKADKKGNTTFSINGETKSYSYDALNETLRREMNELAGSYQSYRENKNTLFSLIEQTLQEILPKRVVEAYGQFAEVKTFGQGDKPVFKRRTGKHRAKQFITKVGLAGRYEVFKLGSEVIEVNMQAVGGAAQIGLEEFLDGRVDFGELTQIVMEGIDEAIYREIGNSLEAIYSTLPAAQKTYSATFSESGFDDLIAKAAAFGTPTIYCTEEFAAGIVGTQPLAAAWMSENMKDEYWRNGHLMNYKGKRIVILPQSYTDDTLATKVIDPNYAYIIPGDDKPIKVAFEGQTLVRDADNEDWSKEIQVYKKFGVATIVNPGLCIYHKGAN